MEEDSGYGYGSSDDDDDEQGFEETVDDDDEQGFEETVDDIEFSGSSFKPFSCKVITKESLLAAQRDELQRVMDLLSLREHQARALLIHYCWDADKIVTAFVEKGQEKLYAEAGVSLSDNTNLGSSIAFSEVTCGICYEEFPTSKTTTMDCGHCFCNECWTEHFIVKINEGQSRKIECMAYKCYSICDEGSIRGLVSARDPMVAEKFDRFLLESFIEDNKMVKWCPSVPHCGNAVRVDSGHENCEVECLCGTQFCFNCSSQPHSPCSCLMWENWERKCKVESESVQWITLNTKFCPKCHKPVHKNGGCNLVVCICRQPFCWLCGGATGLDHTYTLIANHNCGRYKEKHGEADEQKRKQVWRYSHYFKRYKAHKNSIEAEASMEEKLQEKIDVLESRNLKDSDHYRWLWDGFHRLIQSRRFLLHSYPFAYYMFGDEMFGNEMSSEERTIKQNLFEDQQQQLEANVERLSMVLGEDFSRDEEEKVLEIRKHIANLSAVTDNFCWKLFDCIDNELLSPAQQATHVIAPYKSKGVEKASDLPD